MALFAPALWAFDGLVRTGARRYAVAGALSYAALLLSHLFHAMIFTPVLVGYVPRRRDPVKVAALGAAVLLAFEIAAGHWFYLYIVWFAPFALVALFTPYVPVSEEPEAESARSNGRARFLRRRSLLPSPTGPRPTSRT